MAKKTKKKAAKKKTTASKGKLFRGDLPKIRKAINAVAKVVEAGRKKAQAQVEKGKTARPGTNAYVNLAANQAALKRAESLLGGLTVAAKAIADECCHNDQGCNFLVL